LEEVLRSDKIRARPRGADFLRRVAVIVEIPRKSLGQFTRLGIVARPVLPQTARFEDFRGNPGNFAGDVNPKIGSFSNFA